MEDIDLVQQLAASARDYRPPWTDPVQGVMCGIRARKEHSPTVRVVDWVVVFSYVAVLIAMGFISLKAWEVLDNPIYEWVTLTQMVMT